MTLSEAPDGSDPTAMIRDVVFRARQAIGSGTKLAARLKELGIGPGDGYSESAVSNWINGRTMPPADVLLAAAGIAGISLGQQDPGPATPTSAAGEWQATADQLQAQVDELRSDIMHIYGQMGMARPQADQRAQGQRKTGTG